MARFDCLRDYNNGLQNWRVEKADIKQLVNLIDLTGFCACWNKSLGVQDHNYPCT